MKLSRIFWIFHAIIIIVVINFSILSFLNFQESSEKKMYEAVIEGISSSNLNDISMGNFFKVKENISHMKTNVGREVQIFPSR